MTDSQGASLPSSVAPAKTTSRASRRCEGNPKSSRDWHLLHGACHLAANRATNSAWAKIAFLWQPAQWTGTVSVRQNRLNPLPLPAFGDTHARPPDQDHARPVHAHQHRTARAAQPHRHGAADAKPRRRRQRADRAQRALLRAARERRADHLGSDASGAGGPGLYLDARHPQRRADQRLAMRDRRGARLRRPHRAPALACRAHLASILPAGRQIAGGAVGHQAERTGLHRQRLRADPNPARARARRDSRHRRAICARRAQRDGSRLRRRRGAWRERLSDRSVPARRHQQAHRRLWWLASRTARASCWKWSMP